TDPRRGGVRPRGRAPRLHPLRRSQPPGHRGRPLQRRAPARARHARPRPDPPPINTLPRHAMHRLVLFLLVVAVGLLFAPGAFAQPVPPTPPALALSLLDDYFDDEPLVEVNLNTSLLRLAAAAADEDEPGTAALMQGLDGITVRVYDLASA